MAVQALFAVTVVGTVALNAADVFLNRLHKKRAKKARIEEENAREKEGKSCEEEVNSSEEEENRREITRRNSDHYRHRPRRSSFASSRLDTSMQEYPPPSRNRSPLLGSTSQLSPNSGPRPTRDSSSKLDTSLEVYKPRNNSFPTSGTARDPAVARQVAHASWIVDEHKRERQTKRRLSSAGAGANVMPRIAAPVTQNLLMEHEDDYREELDPLLLQLREEREQRSRERLFKPKPRPQPQLQPQLERYNTFPQGNISGAPQSISRNQDELSHSQFYGEAAFTPPMKQRRASQPPQWHIPEIEERRRAAEYLASRPIRSPIANAMAPPSPMWSESVSSQQRPSPEPTKNMSMSTSTLTSTEDFGGVPLLSPVGRSSSRSTELESAPRNYSATVSDEASEEYIDIPMGDIEMAEPGRSMVDMWLGNTDTVASEQGGYPTSETYMSEASMSKPSIYVSEVNDEFHEDKRWS